ncbi:MAG TPA: alkaline phosphatase family protein [Longimicrobiales bacterium]|nr:alkaline phosphatase family protein [Longimicrobiales bacterium]
MNAAREFGRHFGPWVPTALRPLVRDENLLVRAGRAGHRTAFANAYPSGWPGERARRRVAGPPLAALGAGRLDRHAEHLARGEAVSSEIVNDGWIRHLGPDDLPRPTPREAGRTLAAIAAPGGLTMYAHYATDTAGHRSDVSAGVAALERVDDFLGGVLEALPPSHRLVVVSDHGNIEDVRRGHTRNPALGLVVGGRGDSDSRAEDAAERLTSLMRVPEVVMALLD